MPEQHVLKKPKPRIKGGIAGQCGGLSLKRVALPIKAVFS
jgi:hypothetical protein